MRLQPPEPGEARKLARDLLGEHPGAADRARGGAGERAREAAADPGRKLEPDAEPGSDPGGVELLLVGVDPAHDLGQLPLG